MNPDELSGVFYSSVKSLLESSCVRGRLKAVTLGFV